MNTNEFTGKKALVTGASRGIGAAVALRLAAGGADVALTYQQDEERAAAVAGKIEGMGRRAVVIRADSGDAEEVTGAVDRAASALGGLDILVNNAGAFIVGPLEELGPAEFERTVAVNVRAPYLAARAAARHMTEGGRVVSIGSNVAERAVFPGFALYAMSKAALVGMTKGLARDLGPRGITVNLVNPGPTDTDANPSDGPGAETIRGFTALGRYAAPDEIAGVVAHLAGGDAGYVTGATVNVDGGFTV
ncbi:SDR family NAD(P)-dependent oxidoreductase [Allostreptomyces psammosilenae]|uniref:3-oxoacyl-[acyl-carrier protein] reductase n=1 Tax=Allostreptomyces psammosilenae TaxID=1892865 RepID=A0A852ZT70_9ACTN|nr:SDR family oxidoreductase [Allostreptomyces psammosilenae]NYI04727.1 3-oxoacyl-[acyl-carrier protein] reductase [Allostreptomyces psammosilenae]